MGSVVVSASRLTSMLRNRGQTAGDLSITLSLSVDAHVCANQDSELTLDDLVALGKHFKRPWSYLLIDEPEVIESVGLDNRSLRNRKLRLSPALIDQLDAVADMLASAAELFPDTAYEVPPDSISTATPAKTAGRMVRHFLGVTDANQLKAKGDFAALRMWVDALQRHGVYVSQRRLDDASIRAFSQVDGTHAVIVVDTGDGAYARIFSLLHEYVHVILRSTGICDLDDHSKVERFCNAVAATAIMPTALVRKVLGDCAFSGAADPDDELLRRLSAELRASQAALLIRLRQMGVISPAHFEEMEVRRANRRADHERKRGGTFYAPRINRVGRRYAREVFGALDGGQLDGQDASTLLEIGEHLLTSYRVELGSGASE